MSNIRDNLIHAALELQAQRDLMPGLHLTLEPCELGMMFRCSRHGHFGNIRRQHLVVYETLATVHDPMCLAKIIKENIIALNREVEKVKAEIAKFDGFTTEPMTQWENGEPNV